LASSKMRLCDFDSIIWLYGQEWDARGCSGKAGFKIRII